LVKPAGRGLAHGRPAEFFHTQSWEPAEPGDLGGELPANPDIRLKRINKTSTKIVSPTDWHAQHTVTITPTGDVKE